MVRRATPKELGIVKIADVTKQISMSRDEAIAVINLVTIGCKLAPSDPPDDIAKPLERAMNRLLKAFDLTLCPCCDLVKESVPAHKKRKGK